MARSTTVTGRIGRLTLVGYISVVVLLVIFPAAVAVLGTFSGTTDPIASLQRLIDGQWTIDYVVSAFDRAPLLQQGLNSVLVTLAQTALQLVTSLLAAYALVFGRLRRFAGVLLAVFLVTMMIPSETTIVANYLTIRSFGLYDTLTAVFIPYAASAYSIFLLRQAFLSFPTEIREAALLDGTGPLRFLMQFLIPLCRPAVVTVIVTSAIAAWNGYLWPLIVTESPESRTAQVGVASLADSSVTDIGSLLAGTVLVSLPTVFLVIFGQRNLVKGLTQGANR
ncbi:carbohydrate ABC transporter permease [Cryobacterium sp. SO1]|uniref:carbohydrate ABC transporter permease n=1 Tax=Cryobacterium sp. SO1 TaxID=1897061 RepID=UPI001022F232|nr:carbohydrate ABC transporter permease [Cryobacterium sp. SO1]RZI36907.1 Lactose transport system permease protein LacG [Cryobacterium sp. SO1]